jgi:hypothetical protein
VKEVVVMEIVVAVAAISITHGGVSVISNIRFESIIDNRHQLGGMEVVSVRCELGLHVGDYPAAKVVMAHRKSACHPRV